jgi:hypothetical protein
MSAGGKVRRGNVRQGKSPPGEMSSGGKVREGNVLGEKVLKSFKIHNSFIRRKETLTWRKKTPVQRYFVAAKKN